MLQRHDKELTVRLRFMPTPIDPRKKPASVKIHVSTGAGVDVIQLREKGLEALHHYTQLKCVTIRL